MYQDWVVDNNNEMQILHMLIIKRYDAFNVAWLHLKVFGSSAAALTNSTIERM